MTLASFRGTYKRDSFTIRVLQVIASLMFLMNCTRPNIAYAVKRLRRYTYNPNRGPRNAIIRVLNTFGALQTINLDLVAFTYALEGYRMEIGYQI